MIIVFSWSKLLIKFGDVKVLVAFLKRSLRMSPTFTSSLNFSSIILASLFAVSLCLTNANFQDNLILSEHNGFMLFEGCYLSLRSVSFKFA